MKTEHLCVGVGGGWGGVPNLAQIFRLFRTFDSL